MAGVALKVFLTNGDDLAAKAGILIVSNAAAFISGLLAVGFLMNYLAKHSLAVFGWYLIALAVVLAIVLIVQ